MDHDKHASALGKKDAQSTSGVKHAGQLPCSHCDLQDKREITLVQERIMYMKGIRGER